MSNTYMKEVLAQGLNLVERHTSLRTERDLHLKTLSDKISEVRTLLAQGLDKGLTTGDHIKDMVVRHHGFDEFEKVVEGYRAFEKKLEGHKGEFVLIDYTAEVPWKHTMTETETMSQDLFRLGILEGEQLIWGNLDLVEVSGITMPVSRYVFGKNAPAKANIFSNHYGGYDPGPGFFGSYILSTVEGLPWPPNLKRPQIKEIAIGDEAVEEWIKKHPFKVSKELFGLAKNALEKFDLEVMGPNEGPLPQPDNDSLVHPVNEKFVERLIDENRTRPLKG